MPTKFGSYRGSDLLGADYTKSHWSEPVSPVAQSDGHDEPGPIGELVPRLAAVVEDVAVGGEDPVRDPVLPSLYDRNLSERRGTGGSILGDAGFAGSGFSSSGPGILPHVLPDVLDRVQLGGLGRE